MSYRPFLRTGFLLREISSGEKKNPTNIIVCNRCWLLSLTLDMFSTSRPTGYPKNDWWILRVKLKRKMLEIYGLLHSTKKVKGNLFQPIFKISYKFRQQMALVFLFHWFGVSLLGTQFSWNNASANFVLKLRHKGWLFWKHCFIVFFSRQRHLLTKFVTNFEHWWE